MFPLTADGFTAVANVAIVWALICGGALAVAMGMLWADAEACARQRERRTGLRRRHVSPTAWPSARVVNKPPVTR